MLSPDLQSFIATTVAAANGHRYGEDPMLGPQLSRLHGILGSLVTRDGMVLQRAVCEALDRAQHLTVWPERRFPITPEAERLADMSSYEACLHTELPLTSSIARTIKVDAIVVDHRSSTATGLEIKRGKGSIDASQRRQTIRDALCVGMLVKAYAKSCGFRVERGCAKVVFYHGRNTLPPEISLVGSELDAYFGAAVARDVAKAAAFFRAQVAKVILPDLLAHDRVAAE